MKDIYSTFKLSIKAYFPKKDLIIAFFLKIPMNIYKLYYITLIRFNQVLNEKIRFNRVYFRILNQNIYITRKIEYYTVQKLKIIS